MVNDHLVTCYRHDPLANSSASDDRAAEARTTCKTCKIRTAVATHAFGTAAGPAGPLPARRGIGGHRARIGAGCPLERADPGAHIFSVAQHALLVEALARAKVPRLDRTGRLAVLLHDAPEYVIGDMISPFKAVIGDSYKAVEKRLLAAIHLRFGVPAKLPQSLHDLIKAADRSAAYLEATRLAGFADDEARKFFGPPPKFSAALERDYLSPWSAGTAQARFRERFEKLLRD